MTFGKFCMRYGHDCMNFFFQLLLWLQTSFENKRIWFAYGINSLSDYCSLFQKNTEPEEWNFRTRCAIISSSAPIISPAMANFIHRGIHRIIPATSDARIGSEPGEYFPNWIGTLFELKPDLGILALWAES